MDQVPSETSYSRLVEKLSESNGFEKEKESILLQAIEEGVVDDENIVIDASHFEARDKAPAKEKKPKPEPKKRGRNLKRKSTTLFKDQIFYKSTLNQGHSKLFLKKRL